MKSPHQSSSKKKKDKQRSRRRDHNPQRAPAQDRSFFGEMADLLIGPDVPPYGFMLASLDDGDKKYLNQLRLVTEVTPNKKAIFHLLTTTEYERSYVPFTSDDNPFGEIAATGLGLIVPDGLWGPDLLEDAADEENYWQLIDAAQEMALNVVFIFIKHKDSHGLQGTCHQKFERLANGPWPRKQPYVFLMSFWDRFNDEQIEIIKSCLAIHDPLQIKVEINRVQNKHKQEKEAVAALENDTTAGAVKPAAQPANEVHENEKGKEKLDDKPKAANDGFAEFKRQLQAENQKQFAAFSGEIKELREEVARLSSALTAKEGQQAGEKGALLG